MNAVCMSKMHLPYCRRTFPTVVVLNLSHPISTQHFNPTVSFLRPPAALMFFSSTELASVFQRAHEIRLECENDENDFGCVFAAVPLRHTALPISETTLLSIHNVSRGVCLHCLALLKYVTLHTLHASAGPSRSARGQHRAGLRDRAFRAAREQQWRQQQLPTGSAAVEHRRRRHHYQRCLDRQHRRVGYNHPRRRHWQHTGRYARCHEGYT